MKFVGIALLPLNAALCSCLTPQKVRRMIKEELILISPDSKSDVAVVPKEGNSIARIAYEILIENPYKYTEAEYHHELHVVRRNKPDLKISSYNVKRSPLLKKFGWGVHKNAEGKMALIPANSEEYRELSVRIPTSYASRNEAKKSNDTDIDENSMPSNLEQDLSSIQLDLNTSDTEKNSLIKARIGQGKFRRDLITMWQGCAVTGCKTNELLVASHIKPWHASDNRERLDKFNGLLLMANIDRAFDAGLISFDLSGKIIISSQFVDFDVAGLNQSMKITLAPEHETYMQYHRKHVFKAT